MGDSRCTHAQPYSEENTPQRHQTINKAPRALSPAEEIMRLERRVSSEGTNATHLRSSILNKFRYKWSRLHIFLPIHDHLSVWEDKPESETHINKMHIDWWIRIAFHRLYKPNGLGETEQSQLGSPHICYGATRQIEVVGKTVLELMNVDTNKGS